MKIDWASPENLILCNPRLPEKDREALERVLFSGISGQGLRNHVFLLTSGTSASSASGFKWVALSKDAVLKAAESSNRHLQCSSNDIWLHSLPDFHIGGLSIWARSTLSGSRVVKFENAWNPEIFVRQLQETRASLCSLVPTQVYDLLKSALHAPKSLRAILLGGGASSPDLISQARSFGWNVLPTYGMSETSSQIATAEIGGVPDQLKILSHLEVTTDTEQRIRVRGTSLLTGYVVPTDASMTQGKFDDPKREGWFLTEDFGKIRDGRLTILGRTADRIKIGGETVFFGRLEMILDEEASKIGIATQISLYVAEDERLESVIHAVREKTCDPEQAQAAIDSYNRRVLPFEKARLLKTIDRIPRTDLGKIKRAELKILLSSLESSL